LIPFARSRRAASRRSRACSSDTSGYAPSELLPLDPRCGPCRVQCDRESAQGIHRRSDVTASPRTSCRPECRTRCRSGIRSRPA
jgi:hypothetical protein